MNDILATKSTILIQVQRTEIATVWSPPQLWLTCWFIGFRYEDFFGAKKKTVSKRKSRLADGSDEDSSSDDEQDDDGADEVMYYVYTYVERKFIHIPKSIIFLFFSFLLFFFIEKGWSLYPWKATCEASVWDRADGKGKFGAKDLDNAWRGDHYSCVVF